MVQPSHSALLLLLCLFPVQGCSDSDTPAAPGSTVTPELSAAGETRLVAVGDLHGDLEHSLAVLRLAGLVDERGAWSAGATVLVQTGDLLDRGDDGVQTVDLLQRLQGEAEAAGGRVEVLLGNHEAMNLGGDWRYVTPGDVAGYGGLEARKAAMAPSGDDGAWLRQRPAAVRIGRTVFVHGGITPEMAAHGIAPLNARVAGALRGEASPEVLGEDGPLWYRGYLRDGLVQACPRLQEALASLGATRMVVGHTTQRSGEIAVRCGGALLGIDTGISEHYGAQLAALELRGEDAWALYPDGPQDLQDP